MKTSKEQLVHEELRDQSNSSLQNDSAYRQFLASQTQSQRANCPLCQQPSFNLLINDALFYKYPDERQGFYYMKEIEEILEHRPSVAALQFREDQIRDEEEEFMRRQYRAEEFEYKHKAISEYYKFHEDYPLLHQKGVQRILQRYYDRKKQCHYKEIKKKLKEEEGISITTHKSSSMFSEEDQEESLGPDGKKKPKNYSNVLGDLHQVGSSQLKNSSQMVNSNIVVDETNESQVLQGICDKIDRAYRHQTISPLLTKKKASAASIFEKSGNTPYVNGQRQKEVDTKKFMKYLQNLEDRAENSSKRAEIGSKITRETQSNKQSRYNSIEHEVDEYNKKYISHAAKNSFKTVQNPGRKGAAQSIRNNPQIGSNAKIYKKTPFFYESGQQIYAQNQGPYGLGSIDLLSANKEINPSSKKLIYSKTNSKIGQKMTPSTKETDLDLNNIEKGVFAKKQKKSREIRQDIYNKFVTNEPQHRVKFEAKQDEELTLNGTTARRTLSKGRFNGDSRSRLKERTTEQIYKNAAGEMKSRRKSINSSSYASLAINPPSMAPNKQITGRTLVGRDRESQVRNRSASQKYLKEKNVFFNNEVNIYPSSQKLDRSKSTSNMQLEYHGRQNTYNDSHITAGTALKAQKTVKVSKETLKGKSLSTSKLKVTSGIPHYRYQNSSSEKRNGSKELKPNLKSDINLFREQTYGSAGKKTAKSIIVDPKLLHLHPNNLKHIDVDSLLSKKLLIQGSPHKSKPRTNKLI